MFLADLSHEPLGGVPLAIVLGIAILFVDRLGRQRNHLSAIRVYNRGSRHLMIVGNLPRLLVDPLHANRQLRRQVEEFHGPVDIITLDPIMLRLLETARQIAPSGASVLITGESGTGKELLARYLHAYGGRPRGPFIAINCGALHEELLANELFGHEKGAFTGAVERKRGLIEAADGGTLFLDEIGEMPLSMQVKLLRVLQERELLRIGSVEPLTDDVRIIAGSNRS